MDQKFGPPDSPEQAILMEWVLSRQALMRVDPTLDELRRQAEQATFVLDPPPALLLACEVAAQTSSTMK